MELEDFNYLPKIDEREKSRRLEVFEKARFVAPLKNIEDAVEVYVAGVNSDKMIVLSAMLDKEDKSLIKYPIAIEPQYIKSYNSIN